jgi:ribonuclease HI
MRVFTDGACSNNGKPGAKAGFGVWFPEHQDWSVAKLVPLGLPQTNQRAELSAIQEAVLILEREGYMDEDIVIYTDSSYSIDCLTKWLPGFLARGWKTSEGTDVKNRDLIENISNKLSKFKGYRFHHVRAHTGGGDDLSIQNDIVDRMARGTIDDSIKVVRPPAMDEIVTGCPLQLMGPPVSQGILMTWLRGNLDTLDRDIVDKHLLKAFTEICKTRDVAITKQTLQKTPMIRAERVHLQIDRVNIEKVE